MVRPEPGSLDLIGEGGQSLFFDASQCAGAPPDLPGLVPCRDLAPYYARKLFTNNAGHAVLAYEGHLAAAMAYRDPDDAEAVRMGAMRAEGGADRVLREVCGLRPDGEAYRACLEKWMELRAAAREGDGA